MKTINRITFSAVVGVGLLVCIIWQATLINELYKNYRWVYEKQCELIGKHNNHNKYIKVLCTRDIVNGGTDWTFDPNDPSRILLASESVDWCRHLERMIRHFNATGETLPYPDPNSRNKGDTWKCGKCNGGYYKYFDMYEGEGTERVLLFECPTCKWIWPYTYWRNEPMTKFISPDHSDTGGRHLWICCGKSLIHAEGISIIGKHDCIHL